jgi:hypothetical protein
VRSVGLITEFVGRIVVVYERNIFMYKRELFEMFSFNGGFTGIGFATEIDFESFGSNEDEVASNFIDLRYMK